MYLEKRKVKGKRKYYLSHSFREGGKVHKIRHLLGVDLSEEVLKDRKEKAEKLILEEISQHKIISDPLVNPLSDEELEFIRKLESKENLKVFHLSEKQWEAFSELFTYDTNAIEGSTLDNKEVREILKENKWPDKPKRDIAEAYGVRDAIKFIRGTKDQLSLELIKEIHKIVFKNSKSFAGEFRKPREEVAIRNSLGEIVHMGAPQSRVVSLLNELVEWYNKNRSKYPTLLLAIVVHNQFENIHPFRDGNGRVGRILLNNLLIKHGLPPVNISFKNRKEYYKTLQAYDKEHNLRPSIDFIIKEYKEMKKKLGK